MEFLSQLEWYYYIVTLLYLTNGYTLYKFFDFINTVYSLNNTYDYKPLKFYEIVCLIISWPVVLLFFLYRTSYDKKG